MERPRLVPQLYGYAVCLVCVITILLSSQAAISALFEVTSPEMSRDVVYAPERFPAGVPGAPAVAPPTVPDTVAQERAERIRRDQIALTRHQGLRMLVGSGTTLLIAVGFFVMHWRWLRGMERRDAA
jgi:hypothetical protein